MMLFILSPTELTQAQVIELRAMSVFLPSSLSLSSPLLSKKNKHTSTDKISPDEQRKKSV